ncbi:hypothetical protein G6F57_014237 [Rhizopus arrhizus]|nr:hypothetical protein G6F57_014237 [Rhizopus arrhizus]
MDVQFGMRRGRGRRQQLVEQTVEALDLRADQLDQLAFAGIALGRAAGQQLGRTLQPGQRVALLVGQPLQRRAERAGQGLGGIEPRELIDRVRLQQPAAIIAAAHPALGEARRLAGHGQRQPVQAQAVALIAVQEMGQCLALHFQCGQGPTQQASRADAPPAGKGRIAAGNAACKTRVRGRGGFRQERALTPAAGRTSSSTTGYVDGSQLHVEADEHAARRGRREHRAGAVPEAAVVPGVGVLAAGDVLQLQIHAEARGDLVGRAEVEHGEATELARHVALLKVVVALGTRLQTEAQRVAGVVVHPQVADMARRGGHFAALQGNTGVTVVAGDLRFLVGVRRPYRPVVAQLQAQLRIHAAPAGLAQGDRSAGGRHVGHLVFRILLPHRQARLAAHERLELQAQLHAGVGGRLHRRLPRGEVGRCSGTGEHLEGAAPVGVNVGGVAQAVDDAQLRLADGAVVLQAAADAVHRVRAATEPVDTVGRHDFPRLGGLVDGLHVGTPVVETVAVVVLHARRRLAEIGGLGVGVAFAEVAVVLLLVIEAAFDVKRGAGLPRERAEQAGR